LKKYLLLFSIAFINPLLQNLLAQENFATIEKNVHINARGLFHDLNKTKDTLILKSDKKINYVYSINKSHQREVDKYLDTRQCKVPLNNLSKGKHVFVVRQTPVLIVFVIRIFGELPIVASIDED